jgi:hypothetical protein
LGWVGRPGGGEDLGPVRIGERHEPAAVAPARLVVEVAGGTEPGGEGGERHRVGDAQGDVVEHGPGPAGPLRGEEAGDLVQDQPVALVGPEGGDPRVGGAGGGRQGAEPEADDVDVEAAEPVEVAGGQGDVGEPHVDEGGVVVPER